MYSIKSSYGDCSTCDLLHEPSCILDTNTKSDLCKADLIIVSDSVSKNDTSNMNVFSTAAGKKFRKIHNKYFKNVKWIMTNAVLCSSNNEISDDTINKCKKNCFELIELCKPKLILAMGEIAMKIFEIKGGAITNLRGNIFNWNNYKVFLTVNPEFLSQNPSFEEKFENDMSVVAQLLGGTIECTNTVKEINKGECGLHRYQIPEKYYSDNYRLVDIQYISTTSEVLYIFRDKENKKEYYKTNDTYVCYQIKENFEAKKIVPYDQLNQIQIPYKEKSTLDSNITYEGDLRLTAKHAMDYYYYNQGEAETLCKNILFFDIEIDTGLYNKTFPSPDEAKYPINLITCSYQTLNGYERICYILDNGTEQILDKDNAKLKIFKKEKDLLTEVIKDWKFYDCDFIAGWNSIGFDLFYIFNRLPQLRINKSTISKFNEFYVDANRMSAKLPGSIIIDQMYLYKMFTFTKMENYKLGFITENELGVTKIQLPLQFNEMYWKMLNTTIEYNIRDVELLEKLEDKLNHINLLNEIRVICNSSFEAAGSSFGQIDSTIVSFLKNKGLSSKNSDPHIEKLPYPGAYVHPPVPGIYDNITDFDFTSLYPSIIMTYNIGINTFVLKTKDPTIGYDLVYSNEIPDQIEIIMDPTYASKEMTISKTELMNLIAKDQLIHTINGCFYKSHEKEVSSFAQVLTTLISARKEYKKKMLDAKEAGNSKLKDFYDTKQLVYKVIANSLYGVIANKAFRFYDNSCAAAITLGGQEALKNSIIEADSYMRKMKTNKELIRPNPITKTEMYSDEMPNIKPEFIITGDTDSIFCTFQTFPGEKTDKQIKEWCDELQNYLNNDIIKLIVEKHHVNLKFNKLELKNELIISRGLFLAKKRYAIHVQNNEGRIVDEMKYMGIEIKRSDYPSASKEFMVELIDLIMKSKKISITELLKYITNKKTHFMKLIKEGHKSIARPVSWGKEIDDYKVIPQGVRAMDAFNKISYNIHSPGSKGYMFKIAGIDESKAPEDVKSNYTKFLANNGKLDVIAIPDEEEKLPEYYSVDTASNLQFAFTDRYELLLKPLLEVKRTQHLLQF